MVVQLLFVIFHFLIGIHTSLYHPQFAPLPVIRTLALEPQATFSLPIKKLTATQVPPIQAGAFLVIDRESGEVLAEKNADQELPPASTTKIMTALIALENMDAEEVVSVPADIEWVGSVMKLEPDERIHIRELIKGLLIHSSNDAATVLARSYPGGEQAFVDAMNAKALELGMTHTHYKNSSGLYEVGHVMTVRDLLILSRYAMHNETFAQIVVMQSADLTSADGVVEHHVETTNQLLGSVAGVEGIKTGYTEEAGECLVTQVSRDGHTILTALLGSPDRFAETKDLIAWVYEGFTWETHDKNEWAAK